MTKEQDYQLFFGEFDVKEYFKQIQESAKGDIEVLLQAIRKPEVEHSDEEFTWVILGDEEENI